jgi:hypothetical protein
MLAMSDWRDKTRLIMKTRATLYLLLVAAAAAAGVFWFSASVSATEKTPAVASNNVVINAGGIVIPGTQISKADQDAMNQILNKYDKSLYRIETYENGKLKKTQGKLTDVVTDKQLASQIAANVKRTGFTQYAVQIRPGSATNVMTSPSPGTTTNVMGSQKTSPSPGTTTNVMGSQKTSPSPGSTTNVMGSQNTSPSPGATTHPQKAKSDDLVERLKPILKKYQRK